MQRLVALVETGTRAVIGAVFGPRSTNERAWAGKLMRYLGPGMLVLNDRGFVGNDLLRQIAETRAHLLVRAGPPAGRHQDHRDLMSAPGSVIAGAKPTWRDMD